MKYWNINVFLMQIFNFFIIYMLHNFYLERFLQNFWYFTYSFFKKKKWKCMFFKSYNYVLTAIINSNKLRIFELKLIVYCLSENTSQLIMFLKIQSLKTLIIQNINPKILYNAY